MIRHSDALSVEPIDYEILWVGNDPDRASVGSFGDFHFSSSPVWRVVSGYLGAAVVGDRLALTSHGHPVGSIGLLDGVASVELEGRTDVDGRHLRAPEAGIALLGGVETNGSWGFTIVHGPSVEKVSNRLALLDSLTRTGGRCG